jgi:hypothetical protein
MDYVYICRSGKNEELRYSLRSVTENAPAGRVWLVGGRPDWYVGDFVQVATTSSKYTNARNNLDAVIAENEISDDFVLMNDDFFFVNPVKTIEIFHGGLLLDKIKRYKKIPSVGVYNNMLSSTHRQLLRLGIKQPLDYELHVPMPMSKSGLSRALKVHGLWRSVYGNQNSLGGREIVDVKIYSSPREGYSFGQTELPYVSTEDSSFPKLLKDVFEQKFKTPSPYESI